MFKVVDEILTKLAQTDESVMLVVADVGNFRLFSAKFPDQFINVGVAELNAIGIAAGLAKEGKRVFVYSVAGFILYRAFEQIKFELGYWDQPVTILGTGVGWRYHQVGRGHHCPDDFALTGLIPNMKRYCPIKESSLENLLTCKSDHPRYIRISEATELNHHIKDINTNIEVLIISLGNVAFVCQEAVCQQGFKNIQVVAVEHLDSESIISVINNKQYEKLIVIEEHISQGGLGEVFFKAGIKVDRYISLPIIFEHVTARLSDLKEYYGYDVESIAMEISGLIER